MSQAVRPGAPASPIPSHIQRVAALLRENRRADAADALVQLLRAPAGKKPAVYVAGEATRGKSCLVNALLAKPNLSPVGVEATTAAPITFFRSEPPEATVFHFGEEAPMSVEVDQARMLATVAGNPGNEQNIRAVAIGTDSSVLGAFDLVDTPGVGGLDSGHGALTVQSLNNADALLFVIEAGAQIRAAELAFLRKASVRVDTVVLVLTKTDAHRGWRTILDDNIAILREQAPRFASCPLVPVSAVLCLRGADYPEDADELRQESGIAELERVLADRVVARATVLRRANLLRAGLGALTILERSLQQRSTALQSGAAGRSALEAEQTRLRDLNRDRAEWPQRLDTEFRRLTLERQDTVRRRTVELRRQYEERLRDISKKDHDSLPGELIADLTALGSSMNEMTAARLGELVASLLEGMEQGSALEQSIGELTGQSLTEEFESVPFSTRKMTHMDKLSLFNTFSSGRGLSFLLTGPGLGLTAGAVVAPPIGLALGFAIGGLFAFEAFRARKGQMFLNTFTPWMRDQIAQAQQVINNSFARASIDLQSQIRTSIRSVLAEREKEINEALASTKATMAAEVERRQQAQRELNRTLESVRSLKQEGTKLRARLTAGPGSPASGPGARPAEAAKP